MRLIVRLAALGVFGAIALSAEAPSREPHTFVKNQLGFSTSELTDLTNGRIAVKLPKTDQTREVAVAAIVKLDVPVEFCLEEMRDIVQFKKSENVLQIGKFSDPPRLQDLAGLTLDPQEIDSIRECRTGKCAFKMSEQAIQRFQVDVDWSSPDYRERVTALTRQMLLEHVQAYLHGGNAALGTYDDKPYALSLETELQALLQPEPYMYGYASELQKYLEEFPLSRPTHTEIFMYWSKETFGLKPVISLTHVTVYRLPPGEHGDVLVASKGIYANHYFEASLGLTAFVHSQSEEAPGTFLIYVNRSRTDALRGFLSGLKRSLIGGRIRDGARKSLEVIKGRLEEEYMAAAADLTLSGLGR